MADKLARFALTDEFAADIKFETEFPDPTPDTKLFFLAKNNDKLCEAKFTLLNTINTQQVYIAPDFGLDLERAFLGSEHIVDERGLTEEERELMEIGKDNGMH